MGDTTFVAGTVIRHEWLNDINDMRYDADGATHVSTSVAGSGAVTRTVQDKLRDAVHIKDFGAVCNGTTDDSAAILAALTASAVVSMAGVSTKISSSITIPAGRAIDMRGTTLIANTGANPVFKFLSASSGLYIDHTGGVVTGTASSFLFAEGSTDTPTTFANYASLIHLNGLRINSTTITTALVFNKAVNSVYIDGANFFCPNGIDASGKNVAIMISNSILYSSSGAAGTYGVRLRSTGGTSYYNEGWQFVNCTIDAYETTHDITDIFDYQVSNSYVGCASGGLTFKFQAPSTNLCNTIHISAGNTIAGPISFLSSAGGTAYDAKISDFIFINCPGTAIAIGNNAANVTISDGKFKAGTGTAVGVVGQSNNNGINCCDLDFDSTYTNGVVLNGSLGASCSVGPLSGPTSGDIIGAARSNILYKGVPVHSSGTAALQGTYSTANLGASASYIVGATIETLTVGFAKGEKGWIVIHLPYSGANAATQNVQVTPPTGMVLRSGTGWNAGNIYTASAAGIISARIPYYCTADWTSGSVVVTNQAGNTLSILNQAWCGVERNWG